MVQKIYLGLLANTVSCQCNTHRICAMTRFHKILYLYRCVSTNCGENSVINIFVAYGNILLSSTAKGEHRAICLHTQQKPCTTHPSIVALFHLDYGQGGDMRQCHDGKHRAVQKTSYRSICR